MMNLPAKAFRATSDGTLLSCRVQPGASRSGLAGAYGEERIKIALSSPPVDGKANQELCRLLAEYCGVSKGAVEVIGGKVSRDKVVKIFGITPDVLQKLLESL
ncbi:MAG: DUF167 domain-containing protein [Victivallales bacterium]|jgi:uncharacterized protein (TIGR00251 family)|nr:DUF167 domain-containing protein [Victivallales bacterium]